MAIIQFTKDFLINFAGKYFCQICRCDSGLEGMLKLKNR